MRRLAKDVVSDLLREKQNMVNWFHPTVVDTGNRFSDLIDGTAVFPGGSGLWRGSGFFGELPEFFPADPTMIVGHNFDSESGYQKSKAQGGELQTSSSFWGVLLAYLRYANIDPSQCFFTNALMGLKPGITNTGSMPTTPDYEAQCREFLYAQIRLVKPSKIIALGIEASKRLAKIKSAKHCHVMHPSARQFKPLVTREDRIREQGLKILAFANRSNPSQVNNQS
jgi:hypothetical protein